MTDELVINEQNFHEYFFDVRTHSPKRGQVMARYCSGAELVDGKLKRDIMDVLRHHDAKSLPKVVRKVACSTEADSYRIPKEMAKDMLSMSVEEVAQKHYKFILEAFFYTQKEHVPDDPHWSIVTLMNLDKFIDNKETKDGLTITSREVTHENPPAGPQSGNGEGVEVVVEEDGPGCGDQRGF